ncbi:Gluconolactonase precursor [Arthrobacter saudimassiliensis]|uniref:Gluconolactonase n=1 Tax=Arthrobacter saudimassiliensis TaxID=1461584 RepID=A0A078MV80_9MICC|nr:Gluconolactonase precursor [Arthrobacter saudimassiliensis]
MRSSDLLPDTARLEKVASGASWAEGPTWIPDRRAVRFSDVSGNRILEYSERTGELSVYAAEVEYTNGRALAPDGSVVQCSQGRRRMERDRDGAVEPLADQWNGRRFNSPNDVVVTSDGTIWFSDPSYGILKDGEGHPGELEYGDHYVFRLDPATGAVEPAVLDVRMPNGLAFSPDETILYVSDTSMELPERTPAGYPGGGHGIRAYDVAAGRWVKNGRLLLEIQDGLADGFRVDTDGNLWTSAGSAVQVFTPDGTLLLTIPVPETVGNLCFGGTDGQSLYITASSSLYRIRTNARDARSSFLPWS